NIEVGRIFQRFEEISGLDFEFDAVGTIARKLTFMGVEWDRALHLVLMNLDLELRLDGDTLHVVGARSRPAGSSMLIPIVLFTIGLLVFLVIFLLGRNRKRARVRDGSKKVSLPEDRIEELIKRVSYLFEVEKIYRQETLSLNALAEKLEVLPHHLSWILNARIGKTFSDFLNFYRIEEVKKRLTDSGEKDLTILDIAFSAGFNSKSAFNKTFKEATGKTPSDFRSESIR
ncbi:MAG: helix-turn-helix domain-containing protein, partial [Candidatus Aminicenantes bacterium]|nr:helix-turn-helix domain-containing protein [Candidatus Aminicenantes bacterium]